MFPSMFFREDMMSTELKYIEEKQSFINNEFGILKANRSLR